ncbi:hypothetical protein SAMN04487906_2420 [Zhouia amylolytica]|nr:hypothetical protein SAMN04487906_2420 [Zhouia amylolytica]
MAILAMAFINVGYSQVGQVELESVTVSATPINTTYLKDVLDNNSPENVKDMQHKVASYDITESDLFDDEYDSYKVFFEHTNSMIIATFDEEGKIVRSYEKFKNVLLPPAIRNSVYQKYPGWTLHKDIYLVSYYVDKDTKKQYRIQLRKDNQKKNLVVDTYGNII